MEKKNNDWLVGCCIAIAAIREKRHFIGFEKSEEYWRKSIERIKQEKQQLTLDFTYE